jgi:hypothetical protein
LQIQQNFASSGLRALQFGLLHRIFRTLFVKGPENQVHSDKSQLTISSSRDLGRIYVTGIMAGVQYWHFLRWFVIRRLMQKTSASARRSSATGADLSGFGHLCAKASFFGPLLMPIFFANLQGDGIISQWTER